MEAELFEGRQAGHVGWKCTDQGSVQVEDAEARESIDSVGERPERVLVQDERLERSQLPE